MSRVYVLSPLFFSTFPYLRPNSLLCLCLSFSLFGSIATAQTTPDPLQRNYNAAHTFQLAGDYSQAAREYQNFLVLALRRIANIRANERDFKLADKLFASALAFAPSDPPLRLDHAILELREARVIDARNEVQSVLAEQPADARAHHLLGKIFFVQKDCANAIKELEIAVVAAPDFDTGYTLAICYLKEKELAKAKLMFEEMSLAAPPSGLAPAHMLFGRAYREANYLDQALDEFKKATVANPKLPKAHFSVALTYLTRDEESGFAAAKPELQAELQNNPDDYLSHYLLGYIAMKERDFDVAERQLSQAIKLNSDNPDAFMYLGQVYSDMNRPADAEPVLRKAIDLTKDESRNDYQISRVHYVLGRILLAKGNNIEGQHEIAKSEELRKQQKASSEQARDIVIKNGLPEDQEPQTEIVSIDEVSPVRKEDAETREYVEHLSGAVADSYNNLGVIYAQQKDFVGALENFRSAADWDSNLQTLDKNWGTAAFLAGRYDEAIPPLVRYLKTAASDERARQRLGMSYFMTGDYPDSRSTLQSLSSAALADPASKYAYGVSLIKTGDDDNGIRLLKELQGTAAESADLHLALGEALANEGGYPEAAREYQKALALQPGLPSAHYSAGLALLHTGQPKKAAEEFRAELSLNPNDVPSKYHLAYVLLQDQQIDEASSLLQQVIEADPKYIDAYYELGKLQLERGQLGDAIANLETGAKLDPEREYIHYQLSIAYRRTSRISEADREMKLYRSLKDKARGSGDAAH